MSTTDGTPGPPPFHSMLEPNAPRLDTGGVIGQALSVYAANFVPFTLLVAVVLLPASALRVAAAATAATMVPEAPADFGSALMNMAVRLLGLLLTQVATAGLVYGVFQQLRGARAGLGECVSRGFRLLLPVLGVAIVTGLLTALGMLLLCVPGIIATCAFFVAVPVAVIERPGVRRSIDRSIQLTSGNRLRILFIWIGVNLLGLMLGLLIGAIFGLPGLAAVAVEIVTIITSALNATLASLVYFRLRQMKESIADVEAIAAVFD